MSEYAGKQFVGIDLHRRRSVVVRTTVAGEVLESVQIPNDVECLGRVMSRAGVDPEVVLEETYGWYWAVDALQAGGAKVHLAHPLRPSARRELADGIQVRHYAAKAAPLGQWSSRAPEELGGEIGERSAVSGPGIGQLVAPGVTRDVPKEVACFVDGVEGLVTAYLPAHFHPVVEAGLDLLRRGSHGHVGIGYVEDLVAEPVGLETSLHHLAQVAGVDVGEDVAAP